MKTDERYIFRVYGNQSVLDATKKRLAWILSEFKNVVVTTSGGKDSIVNYHLLMEVAKKMKRLPVNVLFIDQEIEWRASIDIVRGQMTDPDVNPMWMQIPFRLFNSTSVDEHWLNCWEPKDKARWMRPQESYSFKENIYGADRFNKLFPAIIGNMFKGEKVAIIGGVRCEESPARTIGLTSAAMYKWVTWGTKVGAKNGVYSFYPLYDWHTSDVWKAIHDHGWPYNKIYDFQFQRGFPIKDMRISNFHHETSVKNVFTCQEFEPDTYAKACARLAGLDAAAKFGHADYFPKELPPMFGDWSEYRDYLLEKLVVKPDWKIKFQKFFERQDRIFKPHLGEKIPLLHVKSILTNDWECIKLRNFETQAGIREIMTNYAKEHPKVKLE